MPLAAAGIGAAGSILGGITSGKGASAAAKAQAQSQANALAEQQREYNTNQANFSPFIQAGTSALGGQQALLGLSGNDAQQSAITALQASPLFTSLNQAGTDALLQSAAATGGLRGGNTESALYNNRSQLLAQTIQNQLAGLSGLSSIGVGAAGTAGGLGNQTSGNISNILQQQGNTAASGALAGSTIFGKTTNDLSSILQNFLSNRGGVDTNAFGNAALMNGTNAINSANNYVSAQSSPWTF